MALELLGKPRDEDLELSSEYETGESTTVDLPLTSTDEDGDDASAPDDESSIETLANAGEQERGRTPSWSGRGPRANVRKIAHAKVSSPGSLSATIGQVRSRRNLRAWEVKEAASALEAELAKKRKALKKKKKKKMKKANQEQEELDKLTVRGRGSEEEDGVGPENISVLFHSVTHNPTKATVGAMIDMFNRAAGAAMVLTRDEFDEAFGEVFKAAPEFGRRLQGRLSKETRETKEMELDGIGKVTQEEFLIALHQSVKAATAGDKTVKRFARFGRMTMLAVLSVVTMLAGVFAVMQVMKYGMRGTLSDQTQLIVHNAVKIVQTEVHDGYALARTGAHTIAGLWHRGQISSSQMSSKRFEEMSAWMK